MPRLHPLLTIALVSLTLALTATATADVYYVLPVADVEIVAGELPTSRDADDRWSPLWRMREVMQPYAVLDGEGEIYVGSDLGGLQTGRFTLAVRTPGARDVTGKLFVPKYDLTGMAAVKFKIPANRGKEDHRNQFLEARLQHYRLLTGRDLPGAAWFRHQARQTQKELGETVGANRIDAIPGFNRGRDRLEDTYAMLSGGRAVSENLQLDRLLPESAADAETVPLDSIKGITIEAFDWKELNKGANPQRDPLARLIPDDQYALFFPSFQAMADLADHAAQHGTVALRAAEPRAEDARVRERYERQLGLNLNRVSRALGPALVKSVALTGADPYLRTGADVAVLFEAKDAALRVAIDGQVSSTAGAVPGTEAVRGEVAGVAYAGFRSPDRSVSSYVATIDNAVVVANSLTALERIAKTAHGQLTSLDKLDEYTFFRNRYPLAAPVTPRSAEGSAQPNETSETALLILTDNTIRKWCGPHWRIAASRRTRAAALMADLEAAHLDSLVAGKITAGPLHTDLAVPDAGDFTLGPRGVQSSVYGTLEFLTPIVELDFDKVTQREADLYSQWRQGYERNWSTVFDPIAVRMHASREKLAVDLTVMPLIRFSDYQRFVSISRGAKIKENSGDPHAESLVHGVLALNTQSQTVRQGASMAASMANVDPLSWIGQSIAVYLDDDPLWAELAKVEGEDEMEKFMEENAHRLPVALNVEVKSGLKLIAFLASIRTFIEQAAPGMTAWETLKYRDQSYVKISATERARSGNAWDDVAVYYVAGGDALVVTLSEPVLKRAIDRQLARRGKTPETKLASSEPRGSSPRSAPPWLGENFCLTADGKLVDLLQTIIGKVYHQQMQLRSWANLPVLNEWHARYPNEDPLAIHERFWQTKLVCPGGGQYRWNDQWQTMESTAYGHPAEPRHGAALPALLQSAANANFGQTFEENGLRAQLELTLKAPHDEPAASP